jgi:death-on-curing protein
MIYLTPEQILFIHARIVSITGGSHGVRDIGLLASAVYRPQVTFDGQELYQDLFTKVAALMESLINNHPFIDGNKRTGLTAAGLFLIVNGRKLIASAEDAELISLRIAKSEIGIHDLADWFRQNTI